MWSAILNTLTRGQVPLNSQLALHFYVPVKHFQPVKRERILDSHVPIVALSTRRSNIKHTEHRAYFWQEIWSSNSSNNYNRTRILLHRWTNVKFLLASLRSAIVKFIPASCFHTGSARFRLRGLPVRIAIPSKTPSELKKEKESKLVYTVWCELHRMCKSVVGKYPGSETCSCAIRTLLPGLRESSRGLLPIHPFHWESLSEVVSAHSEAPHTFLLWIHCSPHHSHPLIHLEREKERKKMWPFGVNDELLKATCSHIYKSY